MYVCCSISLQDLEDFTDSFKIRSEKGEVNKTHLMKNCMGNELLVSFFLQILKGDEGEQYEYISDMYLHCIILDEYTVSSNALRTKLEGDDSFTIYSFSCKTMKI